ncbi:hypothetical protein EPUL_006374, partial [Erysiphe pulchra]
MLFRLLITYVVLAFNVGNTSAMFRHRKRAPGYNDLNPHQQVGLEPNGAECGVISYNKQHLLNARDEACYVPHTQNSRKATIYYPSNPRIYSGEHPFFLYPLGKQIMNTKSGS